MFSALSHVCTEYLIRRFTSFGQNGFLNDIFVKFIDKTFSSDSYKRNTVLREALMTMAPFEISFEDSA